MFGRVLSTPLQQVFFEILAFGFENLKACLFDHTQTPLKFFDFQVLTSTATPAKKCEGL